MPGFLPAFEMNPLTLCACQPVASIIWASVAPLARRSRSRIMAPLLSARGLHGSFARAGLAAFFAALASFFGAVALALPLLAARWPLGAPFLLLVPFFEDAFLGATCAPWAATVAAFSVPASVFVMFILFCAFRA